jgi:cell division protein FtsB
MIASLQNNILAMKATKQLPSFVQVLVTLEAAAAENDELHAEVERLQLENDRLWQAIRDGRVVGSLL